MQFKLKYVLSKAVEVRLRVGLSGFAGKSLSCGLAAAGLFGCGQPNAQPPQDDQVKFAASFLSHAEELLNRGSSDRDAATFALSETIDGFNQGAYRTQVSQWQPHVSVETLPDGAKRIAILFKLPHEYAKSEVYRLPHSSVVPEYAHTDRSNGTSSGR